MSHYGILPKYKLNRPLQDFERAAQLDIKTPQNHAPNHAMGVIKMNSTYMDVVDKHYLIKGLLTSCSLFMGYLPFGGFILFETYDFLITPDAKALLFLNIIALLLIPLIILFFVMRLECFRWTHYPIRFNRKNRMVYFCRFDGTFASAKWEDILFFNHGTPDKELPDNEIYAHILSEDRQTVLETFSLPINSSEKDYALGFWEFVRLYMEEGPEQLYFDREQKNPVVTAKIVSYCLDIDEKRESPSFGHDYMRLKYFGLPVYYVLNYPFTWGHWLGRCLVMQTSKVPMWPEWIQKESIIDPNDAYVVSAADNKRFSIVDGRDLE